MEIPIGSTVTIPATTLKLGVNTNADSIPTFSVYEAGGSSALVTDSCTYRDVNPGMYYVQFAASLGNGFETGKMYSVYITATVESKTVTTDKAFFRVVPVITEANVYSINSNTEAVVFLEQYIPRLNDNIDSRSTFNPTTDLVVKANVYQINSNTNSAVLLQSYIPRLDDNVSAGTTSGVVNANVYQINGNTDAAIFLQSYIPRLNDNIDSRSTFNPTTDLVVKANVYQINSNTDAAILLQQRIPRLDDNVTSRAIPGSQMDLIDAPNSTAVTAIQSGLSTFDSTTDLVQANVAQINSNVNSAVLLQSYIPRLDTNISSVSTTFDGVVNANVYQINGNTTAAILLQERIPRLDTNVSGIESTVSGTVQANVILVNGVSVTSPDDFKADVSGLSTFDSATDKVDFVNAPNSIAITAIQLGLSTFDASTDFVNANVAQINSNTQAAIILQERIPRLDDNVTSRAIPGNQMDLVNVPNATAITAIQNGLSTFDASTDLVQANVAQVAGNITSSVSLAQNIVRLDDNVSSRAIPGSQMNLIDVPNPTAVTSIQSGLSTFDNTTDLVKSNVILVNGVSVTSPNDFKADVSGLSTFDNTTDLVQANVAQINGNVNSAVLLQQRIPRLDDNLTSRAIPGNQMDLVNAPNATAITAIQNGLSTFDVSTDKVDLVDAPNATAVTAIQSGLSNFDASTDLVNANVYQINSNTEAAVLLQSYIPRLDTNIYRVEVTATVNTTAIAEDVSAGIFDVTIDGSVTFEQAIKRILSTVANSQVITGTDPIIIASRNSANSANVVVHSHPISSPTGRTSSF